MESGMEIMTTSVERHDPRKSTIINAVSPAAMAPSRSSPEMEIFDKYGLIEKLGDPHARGGCRARYDHGLLDRVDDGQCRGVTVLDDAQQDRAPAVGTHDILLHGAAVMDLSHVLDENSGAIDEFHRDVVEFLDAGGYRVGADGELGVADLCRTGRQRQIFSVDCVDDVNGRQALGLEL